MLSITDFNELYGNKNIINLIIHLISTNSYPKFSIIYGPMGVGKSSIAKLVASRIADDQSNIHLYNCALHPSIRDIEDTYLKFSPVSPEVIVFEEFHTLSNDAMNALLTIIDSIPNNVYIIATTTNLYRISKPLISRAVHFQLKILNNTEMSELCDNYLKKYNFSITSESKQAILYFSKGIPRDLIKTIDVVIAGNCSDEEVFALTDYVSDNFMLSLFSSLKTSTVSFVLSIEQILNSYNDNIIYTMRDFWTRYILTCKGATESNISHNTVEYLNALFNDKDKAKITDFLVKVNQEILLLALIQLNMKLTGSTMEATIGSSIATRVTATNSNRTKTEDKSKIELNKLTLTNLENRGK